MHRVVAVGILILAGLILNSFFVIEVCGDELASRSMDSDSDGLSNTVEMSAGTNAMDADSDDDGLMDGDEIDWNKDSDGDGLINAKDPDSDNDCLTDGTEMGVTQPVPKGGEDIAGTDVKAVIPDTNRKCFTPDEDPKTTTDMIDPDTDGDSLLDGWEDKDDDYAYDIEDELGEDVNYNGRLDDGECCPCHKDTDSGGVNDCAELELGGDPQDRTDDEGLKDDDTDGVLNRDDDFPYDSTQTTDSDGDGYGDNPEGNNPDDLPDDSTQWEDYDGDGYGDNPAGFNADAFPYDKTQWEDADGDGFGDNKDGNNADAFPFDPAASKDTDGDGYPDAWNEGKTGADSKTGLQLDYYPNDGTKWKEPEGTSDVEMAILLPIIIAAVLIIIALIVIFMIIKQKRKNDEEDRRRKAELTAPYVPPQQQYSMTQMAPQTQQAFYQYGMQQPQSQYPQSYGQQQTFVQQQTGQRNICMTCGQQMTYQGYVGMFYCMQCNRYQ